MGRSRDLADGTLAELNVDSNTLAVDATNNRVGIGTTSDGAKLKIVSDNGQIGLQANAGDGSSLYIGASGSNYFDSSSGGSNIFRTSSTERMRIDSSGRVTMPYQPMAVARLSSDVQGSSDLLLFDTTDINIGSHYNTSLKRFTAPVAGRYYIAVEVQFHSGATQIYTGIKVNKNGGQVCDAYTNQYASNAHARITVNRVFELSANDYLEVRVAGSAGTYPTVQGGGGNRTAFTCFLLS